MLDQRNQRFGFSGLGILYRTSLEMVARHLEDRDGRAVDLDELSVDQLFFVF